MSIKSKRDSLGDRMKSNYENRSKTFLTRRTPVIIRLDGKAFHTFTKGLKRPYDEIFHNAINETMKYLCENVQGCKLGYTQSDEITLLLTDYDMLDTEAYFDYNVQKICSVTASMATMEFNKQFQYGIDEYTYVEYSLNEDNLDEKYISILENKLGNAMFDARCFNIPEDEVVNCFIWRQQDATRNAINMLGQTHFKHKELQGKSCNDVQDMLMLQKGINFNDMPTYFKRGTCCIKKEYQDPDVDIKDGAHLKTKWELDFNIPIFTKDRYYIEKTFKPQPILGLNLTCWESDKEVANSIEKIKEDIKDKDNINRYEGYSFKVKDNSENKCYWEGYSNNGIWAYRCSKCGVPQNIFTTNLDYCPNCGAKME